MEKYTNYCSKEQTIRAYKLGAPIELRIGLFKENRLINPTTQQMMNWMEKEHKINADIDFFRQKGYGASIDLEGKEVYYNFVCQYFETRQEAELAVIDAALDYIEKKGE